MRITDDVELPDHLVEAHANDRVVFFVGAGASMPPPSNLPSFRELARQLADAARVPFDDRTPLDLFLGSMPTDFDTHGHAKRLISRSDSQFNAAHSAVVQLAAAHGTPRIVTTNFDIHLTRAAAAAHLPECDVWAGPALPLGDVFTGIVHLHGSVLRPATELVLTDRDFGRAYLTDAWATRFLQRMFDEFTVLFVGYSHDDPIMQYLALGLRSSASRYVLTEVPDADKWKRLGISPLPYPVVGNDHSAMVAALEEWNRLARMGRLDHHDRMKEIVEAGPPLSPVDEDYVRQRLLTADGAQQFTKFARDVRWLVWMEGVETFRSAFTGGPDTEIANTLTNWLAQAYIADPALNGAALQAVQRLGQRFSPSMYQSLSWAATYMLTPADADAGRRWRTLLATSIAGMSAPRDLEMLVPVHGAPGAEELALVRVVLRPTLVLRPDWGIDPQDLTSPPRADPMWHVSSETLTGLLGTLVAERDPGDPALGAALEDALANAYELLACYHGVDSYDSLSAHRSAIEPHAQDSFRQPVDALIDALRDYGTKALRIQPDLPARWWAHNTTLFRRLALHLVAECGSLSADQKIAWVLERQVLYDLAVKHEVFRVLATAIPDASAPARSRLLTLTLEGREYPNSFHDSHRYQAYSVYNLLFWMTRSDPTWLEADNAFQTIQSGNPTFEPREFPDLDSWSSNVTWGQALPIDVEEFAHAIEDDPDAALTTLLDLDYSEGGFQGPAWGTAIDLVRRAAAARPDVARLLWGSIDIRAGLGDQKLDLLDAIVDAWAGADLADAFDQILALVAQRAHAARSARTIARFLESQIEKHLDSPESDALNTMRQLARSIWEAHNGTYEPQRDSEPSFRALNSWPGALVRYWILEVNRRWREHREDWSGLNDAERTALEDLLNGPEPELRAIRPALASHVNFLFAADATFAQLHILPLFDGPQASEAWSAYLYGPRYSDEMLDAGFLQSVLAEWHHIGDLRPIDLRAQFYGLVASIVVQANISAEQRQELLDRAVLSDDGDHAARFAGTMLRFFQETTIDGAALWELWARDHLTARLDGLPRVARAGELERWADIAPFVGRHVKEAFDLLKGRGIGLGDEYRSLSWPADMLTSNAPEFVAYLAERVRNTTPSSPHAQYSVRRLLADLTAALGSALCAPLVAAANDAGFTPSIPEAGE